jgi:hypothetical protein
MTDLLVAFQTTEDVMGGSFNTIEAAHGMVAYFRAHSENRIDQAGLSIVCFASRMDLRNSATSEVLIRRC